MKHTSVRAGRITMMLAATAGLMGGAIVGDAVGVPTASAASAEAAWDGQDTDADGRERWQEWRDQRRAERLEMIGERLDAARERLHATLQELVDNGTLNSEQLDAIVDHLQSTRLERFEQRREEWAERFEQRREEWAERFDGRPGPGGRWGERHLAHPFRSDD